jgi:hypothetical protein
VDYRGSLEKKWEEKEMTDNQIILLVAVLYVAQAVIGGLIARRRGKSFWFWFAVCFLIIPPFGWIRMFMGTRNDLMP